MVVIAVLVPACLRQAMLLALKPFLKLALISAARTVYSCAGSFYRLGWFLSVHFPV